MVSMGLDTVGAEWGVGIDQSMGISPTERMSYFLSG